MLQTEKGSVKLNVSETQKIGGNYQSTDWCRRGLFESNLGKRNVFCCNRLSTEIKWIPFGSNVQLSNLVVTAIQLFEPPSSTRHPDFVFLYCFSFPPNIEATDFLNAL